MMEPTDEVEIISPNDAAAILEPQIEALEEEGWITLVRTDFMARLTKGNRNLDLEVDLLGNLKMEERPLTLVQESGQIVAVVLLLVIGLFALVVASLLGLF